MSDLYAIRLSGSGGQGLILAGVILAEAAGLYDGHHAAQSQSYGPEARGGNSMAEVLISPRPIAYPHATSLNLLVALTEEAAFANLPELSSDGLFIIDPDLVHQPPRNEFIPIPCTRLAFKTTKKQIAANMVALGAVSQLCPLVTAGSIKKAMKNRLPAKIIDSNLKAFAAGQKEAAPFAKAVHDGK